MILCDLVCCIRKASISAKTCIIPVKPVKCRCHYNGKELNEEFGLVWLDFGHRWYDPALGRFPSVDPIADQFAWVSPFNYAENEPIANIDLHGLQKVSINDVRNAQGQITERKVNVSVSMKVLNLSSKQDFQFNNSLGRASGKASRSFSTSFNRRVADGTKGLTDSAIPVSVKFDLSVKNVSSLDQVSDIDHFLMIVDQLENKSDGNRQGLGEIGGNLSLVEAGELSGSSSETLLHELGHNLGLDFSDFGGDEHSADGTGLMGANINGQTSVPKEVLRDMVIDLGGGSNLSTFQRTHKNTKKRAKEFLNDNTKRYDKSKASKSGF